MAWKQDYSLPVSGFSAAVSSSHVDWHSLVLPASTARPVGWKCFAQWQCAALCDGLHADGTLTDAHFSFHVGVGINILRRRMSKNCSWNAAQFFSYSFLFKCQVEPHRNSHQGYRFSISEKHWITIYMFNKLPRWFWSTLTLRKN